ncbi:potassium channel family protein [Streptomyces sp. NR30]|uniref:Potassium channel family protein n=1 Tax=Streptomyces guryensis TaxID=2886947 RepID=A0A9Q3Z824_9ACTN|nr:potassium channel family protein [Streptomyces guryensis]
MLRPEGPDRPGAEHRVGVQPQAPAEFLPGSLAGGFSYAIDYLAWAAFAFDYGVRLYLVQDRRRFVVTHPLDLIAVLVPAIRSLRVLAIFGRVTVIAQRSRSERLLIATALVGLTVVLVGAGAVLDAERNAVGATIHSYADAVWWALTTVTTVGYGDQVPVTPEGRVVGGILMVVGIGTVGTVTATLAYRFITNPDPQDMPASDHERLKRIEASLAELTELLRER